MKKKLISPFLLLLLLSLTVIALSSCGCKHEQTAWKYDLEATCESEGLRHMVCGDCGKTLEEGEYTVGHRYESEICVFCGEPRYGEELLEFEPVTVNGKIGYRITSIGSAILTHLRVPAIHNGKPVYAIADGAFRNNTRLEKVTFPASTVIIGDLAFADCSALKAVVFAEDSALTEIGKEAFSACSALTSFAIPSGVTVLQAGVFSGCTSLTELALHDGITRIDGDALEGCAKLNLTEQNGISYLGSKENAYLVAIALKDKSATSATLEPSTKFINSYAFAGATALTDLSLPDALLQIGDFAFSGCTSLTLPTLPSTLTSIGSFAFSGCRALTSLSLPASLRVIGSNAFRDCVLLSSISLPDGLLSLGAAAFFGCTSLDFEVFGNGTYLGNTQNPHLVLVGTVNTAITSLTLHENTRVIADIALSDCTALTSLMLPSSLCAIGADAFTGCTALSLVTFPADTEWYAVDTAGDTVGSDFPVTDAAAAAAALRESALHCYIYKRSAS
ncbi:MAG: leucine-rich repeat domain-containing protein [Ruminococcaceae bacterium]|nr:leucine-rich repeat domain-containing protein [Oscillospiraceae bacterium]